MQPISIVTDSTLDLPDHLLEMYEVHVVPLTITLDNTSYTDRVDISAHEFLLKLKQSEDLPKTSQPAVGQFVSIYEELAKKGHQVLSIHMTGGMSGTVESARTAASQVDADVTVVDSLYTSSALGFQVLEAAKMAAENYSMASIVTRLNEVRASTTLMIMVDTLEYLKKGGRIGRVKALIGSLLKRKPVARLEEGTLSPINSVRTHSQVMKQFMQTFEEETKGRVTRRIAIAHADAEALAQTLKEKLLTVTSAEMFIVDTTAVVTAHTGPGALALMYYTDQE
ncbi:DegV family protein [Aureibacillus halotolerans]|uniref:DegV family protein with EDD domain n=1 Tax=Aureibacillus halotolerans TaxID=1508390 RepID=A0A4V3D654_9BACI|nr:DegV family protein [Aureibacillus halotolerans]TDQ42647.1 DegV family protein with EDD domain [Aureibacillus halotolerans]